MKMTFVFLMIISAINLSGQLTPSDEAQPIVAEGKKMYYSEMASWYGTDLFLEKHPDRSNLGGYFSYQEADSSICIFFSKESTPKVIGMISFDSSFDVKTAKVNLEERTFSSGEFELYQIRKIALSLANSDTMFKRYQKFSLNFIPLINGKSRKVYILTGPEESGVVVFGNDYLISFNENNEVIEKKQLHRNIIPVYYSKQSGKLETNQQPFGAVHSHLPETGEFITSTDICTLMLYEKFADWKNHIVVSEKYMNIWNCETNTLIVVPKESIDKKIKGSKKKQRKNEDHDAN